jgi:hypothetical protein
MHGFRLAPEHRIGATTIIKLSSLASVPSNRSNACRSGFSGAKKTPALGSSSQIRSMRAIESATNTIVNATQSQRARTMNAAAFAATPWPATRSESVMVAPNQREQLRIHKAALIYCQ